MKVKEYAVKKIIKLSDETIHRQNKATIFLNTVSDVTIFVINVIKNIFSRGFEFREFLK